MNEQAFQSLGRPAAIRLAESDGGRGGRHLTTPVVKSFRFNGRNLIV